MTRLVGEQFERKVRLEGPANFRDVGGYFTGSGARVRTGLVFRSDSLSRVTEADAEILGSLGVCTVIDLRTLDEVDRTPPALLDQLRAAYAGMLDRFGDRIAAALDLVASSDKPLVFYCEAGKDRTGLVAALLLSTLGVSDNDVAADYALTAGALPVIVGRVRDGVTFDAERAVPDHALTAEEATMRQTLDALRERYGSVETYLGVHGLSDDAIETLRADLLQPGSRRA